MSQEPKWQSISLSPDEDTTTPATGNFVKTGLEEQSRRTAEPEWRSDPYEHESRSHLVFFCMLLMAGLCLAYVFAGWSHIKSIDDVIKLLAPALQLVTTLLGAVIGYFLYQAKSST